MELYVEVVVEEEVMILDVDDEQLSCPRKDLCRSFP
jgi:hypothetical protein